MKLTTLIKFYCLLVLAVCIVCPTYVTADLSSTKGAETNKEKPGSKKSDEDKDKSSTQQTPSSKTQQDETIAQTLFNNATYDNFANQEDTKVVDKSDLEPQT